MVMRKSRPRTPPGPGRRRKP